MKALVNNKLFNQLSPSERKRLVDTFAEQENHDIMVIIDIFLKISCKMLHNNFGYGEKRLRVFLENWRREFRNQARDVRAGTQNKKLDAEMRDIFGKEGYPDYVFKGTISDWNIETNTPKEDKADERTQ